MPSPRRRPSVIARTRSHRRLTTDRAWRSGRQSPVAPRLTGRRASPCPFLRPGTPWASASTRRGDRTSALAKAVRCCFPTEIRGNRSASFPSPSCSSSSSTRSSNSARRPDRRAGYSASTCSPIGVSRGSRSTAEAFLLAGSAQCRTSALWEEPGSAGLWWEQAQTMTRGHKTGAAALGWEPPFPLGSGPYDLGRPECRRERATETALALAGRTRRGDRHPASGGSDRFPPVAAAAVTRPSRC